MKNGTLVISLDMELYWGVRNSRSLVAYQRNLEGTRQAVEELLVLFDRYGVHATWAAVGFLLYKNFESLQKDIPALKPQYHRNELSAYFYMENVSELLSTYHFAPELIDRIREHDFQEIGTHTFSHYYCLEDGADKDSFAADLAAAVKAGSEKEIRFKSIVFPRNQVNEDFLPVLSDMGITSYRGTEKVWFCKAVTSGKETKARRGARLLDAYVNLSGHNTYALSELAQRKPYNIPSSRFLRPVSSRLLFLENLRMRRITKAMTFAARNGRMFHLWWHPHNFGLNTSQNIQFLKGLLDHFLRLKEEYGMESLNMGEISEKLDTGFSR